MAIKLYIGRVEYETVFVADDSMDREEISKIGALAMKEDLDGHGTFHHMDVEVHQAYYLPCDWDMEAIPWDPKGLAPKDTKISDIGLTEIKMRIRNASEPGQVQDPPGVVPGEKGPDLQVRDEAVKGDSGESTEG